jgi:hypothetical protein
VGLGVSFSGDGCAGSGAVFGFLGVPQIVQAIQVSLPSGGGCGPIGELGTFSAAIIGGLAGLRMLRAVFTAVVSASLGGTVALSGTSTETAEAVFGMLLVAAAVPTAAWFRRATIMAFSKDKLAIVYFGTANDND